MLLFLRKTQQWSVYPLITCFVGAWLIVVSQFCVASINVESSAVEHGDTMSPCNLPVTDDKGRLPCCDESSPCGDMEMMTDDSISLPMLYEVSSFDFAFIAYNLPDQFSIPHTTSVCSLYHDPEGANLLPIERFCVQLK
ncbi:MAG: hypothetical protein ACI9SC_000826 [Gammaproteobacteria bacterium]|jgi:hypothetical protein